VDDKEKAYNAALKMEIPEKNIKVFTDATSDEIQNWWKKMLGKWSYIANTDNEKIFIFTYCAGHGAATTEQCFLLN